jgi:glutamine amidotransferase
MCRFYAHHAARPLSVANELLRSGTSLLAQSCCDRRGEAHGDGWGIGHYVDDRPRVVRRATAAATSAEFRETAESVRATTILAHVRQASVGERTEANSHPFAHGRWMFAHNGTVTGFANIGPRLREQTASSFLAAIQGTTDSELVFYWLLTKLGRVGIDAESTIGRVEQVRGVVAASVRQLADWCAAEPSDEPAKFNFLLTNGRLMVATRWKHALHVLERNGPNGTPSHGRAVVVASEPATNEPWREVADGSVVTIDQELAVDIRPI